MDYYLQDKNEDQQELVIPTEITREIALIAQAFVKYFASQRKAMNKVKQRCPI